jgi:transposase
MWLNWKTVKEIDTILAQGKRALQREFANPDYANLRLLAIDELSYKKRHKYLTLVLDLEHMRVVWVGIGRKQATLKAFFDEIGDEIAKKIKAVALDMWDPYLAALAAKAPQAEPVFDKFHVIRNYSKVIDQVRLEEFRKAEKEDRKVLKGTKYLLLKDRENLTEEQDVHMERLLELNKNLNLVYIFKDDLHRPGTGKRLWDCGDRREATCLLSDWIQTAGESGIEMIRDFAGTLSRYVYGLLNPCDYPINTGRLEGLNNKIKVIKRRCYGFHDLEYFALKIKQASVLNRPP